MTTKFTKEHEWAKLEGDTVIVGITDYAAHQLGDVVFVELPAKGSKLQKDKVFGTIESVKAVAEVFSPLAGEIVEVNSAVVDEPELLNDDPHHEGWLVKIRISTDSDLSGLMNAAAYEEFIDQSGH